MARYLLALDQGTTSSRALLYREDGSVAATAHHAFPQYFPQPGWVEHDPDEIWVSQLHAARDAIALAEIEPQEIVGIGIANQRETVVAWERATLTPVGRATVWQDRRTAADCDALIQGGHASIVSDRSGLVLDPYFSASKIAWLMRHTPGLRARAIRGEICFGTVDAWLVARLTNGKSYGTDRTNASRTMLYNIDHLAWDDDLLRLFDVPPIALPEVRPSGSQFGVAAPEHLGASIPIGSVVGDQQAATFGQHCTQPGQAKNTYGTGCFLLMVSNGRPRGDSAGLLTTLLAGAENQHPGYALEGSVFVAGSAVQWLRDGLGIIATAAESEAIAATVPASEGVYVVPAFVGLGAPYWDAHARGMISGLTRGTRAAHIVRATLESIAFQTRDVVDAMERTSGVRLHQLRVDGGATANDLLMQIQADVLGRAVVRPADMETTARGAAMLAGATVGLWSQDGPAAEPTVDRYFEPHWSEADREHRYRGWKQAVERVRSHADA